MSKKDLLFITEGEADEPDFIKKFIKINANWWLNV